MIVVLFHIYSYLYYAFLSLFLLAMALLAWSDGTELHLGMLPWTGRTLTYWLLGLGAAGLLSVFLALTGRFRFFLMLFAIAVFGLMFRGYFLTPYQFHGNGEFQLACWLTGGALVAMLGALTRPAKKFHRRRH